MILEYEDMIMCGYEHFDFDSVEPLAGVSVLQTPFACVANHTGPVTGNAPPDLDFGAFQGKRPLPPFPDDIETGLRVMPGYREEFG